MREQYIKQVKKELAVSRKLKHEVLWDLNEAFDFATEHGETEEQIILRRLGQIPFAGCFCLARHPLGGNPSRSL